MGILQLFGGSRDRFRSWLTGGATLGLPAQSYAAYVEDAWAGNPYARRCIALIAGNAARVPLFGVTVKGDERTPLDRNHPLSQTLRRPNPMYGAARFWERGYQALMLDGDMFAYVAGPDADTGWKAPAELYNVRPDWVEPKAGGLLNILTGYDYKPNGVKAAEWDTDECIHLWLPDPIEDYDGSPPAKAAWSSIQQSNAAGIHNYSLLRNGNTTRLAWTAKDDLTDEQWLRSKKMIEERHTGPTNAGKPIITDAFTVTPVGLSLAESEYIEGVKLTMRQIATTWFVPSVLLNDVENRTHNNLIVSLRILYELNIFPMLDWVCDDLTAWFAPKYGDDIVITYDPALVDVLQEDTDKLWTRNISAYQARVITKNQVLAAIGLPEVKGGDEYAAPPALPAIASAEGLRQLMASKSIRTEMDARRMPWFQAIEEVVLEQFDDEADAYAAAVEHGATATTIGSTVDSFADAWLDLLFAAYHDVGDEFAAYRFKQLGATASRPIMRTSDAADEWNRAVQAWIADQAAEKVREIAETTKAQLRAALAEGTGEGESISVIAQRIRATTIDASVSRSVVIARTEVLQASNVGSRAGAKATGLVLKKHWLASSDDRTRPTHIDADRNYADGLPIDEPYLVGGYQMMFPGDSSLGAAAEEVIQCRCTETYSEAA